MVGELVNQNGGKVTIINPSFGEVHEPTHRVKRQHWKRLWRLPFGIYLTLSNCRTKLRLPSSDHECKQKFQIRRRDIKRRMYEEQQGICPHCGKHFEFQWMELHHILPWGRFPELRERKDNYLCLCHDCHKDIHMDPYLNIRLIEAKAKEYGIDLTTVYKTGAVESEQECAPNDE